jgi:glutathione S-transferase
MPDITLYGRKTSVNVQKAVWVLEELRVPYTQVELGLDFGGLDTPEYLAMNPNGLVPTLKDGELVLWESHAVVRYLAGNYGAGNLWPESPRVRALADQWTDWTATRFQPAWTAVFTAVVRTKPEARDKAAIARAVEAAKACFRILDPVLARTPYLLGDRLTYGDIAAGAMLYRWYTMDIPREPMAGVDAWYERLKARPAYAKGVCVDYDVLRNRIG